jgi:replicative superfamily II helicase
MELAMLRLLAKHLDAAGGLVPPRGAAKAVYVAPLRALVQERCRDWGERCGGRTPLPPDSRTRAPVGAP